MNEGKVPLDHIIELKGQVGALQQAFKISERERNEGRKAQEEIRQCLTDLTARMDAMPDDLHREHHEYINTLIRESEQRQRIRAAVLEKLASGGVWAAICGISALAWYGIKHKLGIGE